MKIRIPVGRLLSGVGKTLVTIAVTAAAQALSTVPRSRLPSTSWTSTSTA